MFHRYQRSPTLHSPFPEVAESVQEELDTYRAQEDEVKRLKSIMVRRARGRRSRGQEQLNTPETTEAHATVPLRCVCVCVCVCVCARVCVRVCVCAQGLEAEDEGAISMLSDNTAKLTSAVR